MARSAWKLTVNQVIFVVAVMLFTVVLVPLTCQASIFNVKTYGAHGDGITDDRAAIQATINAAIAAGANNEVYIPAGNYLLSPDSQSTSEELDVFAAQNLTIQGVSGTVLINPTADRNFFYLWAATGLTFSNLVMKRTQRMFSQMVVNSINTADNTIIVTLMAGYDQLDAPNVSSGEDFLLVYSNPSTGTWGDHQHDCAFFAPGSTSVCWPPTVVGRQKLSSTQWKLTLDTIPQANYVGAQAVMWVYRGGGMGFLATASQNVLVQKVAYYPSGANIGFYLAGNVGPFTFDTFTMDVMPGTKDLVTAGGGSYVLNNHTALTIKNSRMVGVWDDVLDIGANSARVYDVVNSNTIDVDGSRADFAVGDTFGIWDWTYQKEYQRQQAKALAVSCASSVCRITFDQNVTIKGVGQANSLPEDQDGIDRVVDINSAGSLTVTNSTFQSLHARDLVFRTSNTVITGNIFKNTIGPAVYTGFDFDCDEGPSSSNDTITNNTFTGIGSSNVMIGTEGDGATFSTIEKDFSGIKVANNVFGAVGEFAQGPVGNPHAPVMFRASNGGQVLNNKYSPFSPSFSIAPQGVDYGSDVMASVAGNTAFSPAQFSLLTAGGTK